jgi:hypothetical protein
MSEKIESGAKKRVIDIVAEENIKDTKEAMDKVRDSENATDDAVLKHARVLEDQSQADQENLQAAAKEAQKANKKWLGGFDEK